MTLHLTRRTLATATTALACLLAAACSGEERATTLDTSADVTLTWWTGQNAEAEKLLEGLAAEYEGEHPNVTIDVSSGASTTDDLLQKLAAGFASDRYPDISYAYGSWAGQLAASGRTQDITEDVADPSVRWDEFSEAAQITATPSGTTIGFPAVVDNLVLIYNKTLFADAGVPEPTNDWTWADFRAAAEALTDTDRKLYGTAFPVSGGEDTTWHLWPLLWQLGGEILSEDGSQATFDSPEGVEALTTLQQVAQDGSMYLDQTDNTYGTLFASGRVGMIVSGPWTFVDLEAADLDYGVTYLPGFDGNHESIAGADIWTLFDHGDANRAHWSYEFIKWLTDPEQDIRYNIAIGNTPLRESEAQSPEFQEAAARYPGKQVVLDNFANITHARPTDEAYVGLSAAVGDAIAQVLQGDADPQEALDQAAEAADQEIARTQR